MVHALSEVEKAILKVQDAERRVEDQRERVAQLRAIGSSAEMAERILWTLQTSLGLMKAHLGRLTAPTMVYRCYLMTGDTVHRVEIVDCPDDAEAFVRAASLFDVLDQHDIEIRQGKRIVGRIPRRAKQQKQA